MMMIYLTTERLLAILKNLILIMIIVMMMMMMMMMMMIIKKSMFWHFLVPAEIMHEFTITAMIGPNIEGLLIVSAIYVIRH